MTRVDVAIARRLMTSLCCVAVFALSACATTKPTASAQPPATPPAAATQKPAPAGTPPAAGAAAPAAGAPAAAAAPAVAKPLPRLTATSKDGTKIAYEMDGTGPALVLVHGGGQTRKSWTESGYLEKLRTQFTVIDRKSVV